MSNLKDINLTEGQQKVLDNLKEFVENKDRIFVLKGYAGTGKTTLMRFLIEHLKKIKRPYKLLAPTGRASKILANYTGSKADTVHSMIYSYKSFNRDVENIDNLFTYNRTETAKLHLVFEPVTIKEDSPSKVVYIIDESSMISDFAEKIITQAKFGTGRLLSELLGYDPRKDSKYIFVGDPAQLPPVNGYFSPAMQRDYIAQTFNYSVQEASLTQIMRQTDNNTITQAAASIRKLWQKAPSNKKFYGKGKVWGMLPLRNYKDIHLLTHVQDIERLYLEDVRRYGYNHTVIICRSNAGCRDMSEKIRKQLGYKKDVEKGDLLMVCQNQYTTGLMNGDMVEVVEVMQDSVYSMSSKLNTSLKFLQVKVKELFSQREFTTLLIEESITSSTNNLDAVQQTALYVDFIIRMKKKGITEKNDKKKFDDAMKMDQYLNALRCSYGYAITCHKAQGGEWNNVYIHIDKRNLTLNPTKETYQWIYTAITRAKEKVFFVDDFFIK
ncbi:MAG: AAA family ATPase [Bacteroidales bacterium]|nr:AAA family ATPase [Bacteroidales bacterium]